GGSGRAEHLGGGRLVEAAVESCGADRLEQAESADRVGRRRVVRHLEGDLHMAHRTEVVDLVRLDVTDQVDQADAVGEIAVVEVQSLVLVQGVDAGAGQHGGAAYE